MLKPEGIGSHSQISPVLDSEPGEADHPAKITICTQEDVVDYVIWRGDPVGHVLVVLRRPRSPKPPTRGARGVALEGTDALNVHVSCWAPTWWRGTSRSS